VVTVAVKSPNGERCCIVPVSNAAQCGQSFDGIRSAIIRLPVSLDPLEMGPGSGG
jgi:hypothetical protein